MAFWTESVASTSVSMTADLGSSTSGDPAPKAPYLAALAGDVEAMVVRRVARVVVWRNWSRVVDWSDWLIESSMDCCLPPNEGVGANAMDEPTVAAIERAVIPEIFILLFIY